MLKVFIHDEFGPESIAMMQALYSRSPESVEVHAKRVSETGSANFMKSYYVGYGHASIGDCGTTTIFFEGVSILAAKSIQDNPLYSGQETSTRYIDFSRQPLHDPLGLPETTRLIQHWIDFYVRATPEIRSFLSDKFPCSAGEDTRVWAKAINARGFDILRGFLPAGATTQLSWSTNLRQAYDKLTLLQFHPLEEVRKIARLTMEKLVAKYPSSFSHPPQNEVHEYYKRFSNEINYSDYECEFASDNEFRFSTSIDNEKLECEAFDVISSRPKGARLPRYLSKFGQYHCSFLLDYGSFRDLQRHRNGLCRLPVLTGRYGFNSWYLRQLPPQLLDEANELIASQFRRIREVGGKYQLPNTALQYFWPLGTNVVSELVYDLPEMVYVTELRSSTTVHPTLRNVALNMHNVLSKNHPRIKLYSDLSGDIFDIRRGTQDIERID